VTAAFVLLALAVPLQGTAGAETAGRVTEEQPRVLVLTPTGDVAEDKRQAIASLIAVELDKRGRYQVLTAGDLQKAVALEGEKQAAGCDEESCLAEVAGALGAQLVVFSETTKLGDGLLITLNLFDATEAKSVARESIDVPDLSLLSTRVKSGVAALLGDGPSTQASPPPAGGQTLLAVAWLAGFVGVGSVVAVTGLAYDLLSPTSMNGAWDLGDTVGPSAYVVGAGLVTTGVLFNPFGWE
jgi:hypothetical protein